MSSGFLKVTVSPTSMRATVGEKPGWFPYGTDLAISSARSFERADSSR